MEIEYEEIKKQYEQKILNRDREIERLKRNRGQKDVSMELRDVDEEGMDRLKYQVEFLSRENKE